MKDLIKISRITKNSYQIQNYLDEIRTIENLFDSHNIKPYCIKAIRHRKNATNIVAEFNYLGKKYIRSSRVFYSTILGMATQRGATLYKILKILMQEKNEN